MSGTIKNAIVDFAASSLAFDRVHCPLVRSFLVRNWCGWSGSETKTGRLWRTEACRLFAEKVVPLFRRGDYDVAVFQAFREIKVAVRKAGNAKGAGYADSEIGTTLMRKAFHPDTGPLADKARLPAEREAEMHLFSGAIGHAKNPPSH